MKKLVCSLLLSSLLCSTALAANQSQEIKIEPSWQPVYESVEFTCYADKNTLQYNPKTQIATVSLILLNNGENTKNIAKLKIDYANNTVVVLNEEIYKEYGKKPEKLNGAVKPSPIYPDTPTSEITDGIKALIK